MAEMVLRDFSSRTLQTKGMITVNSPIVPILQVIAMIAGVFVFRKDIKDWFHRVHWHIMGVFDHECPRCHRRYLHERDMKSCRCKVGAEDDRGIGVQAPWEKFHGHSA